MEVQERLANLAVSSSDKPTLCTTKDVFLYLLDNVIEKKEYYERFSYYYGESELPNHNTLASLIEIVKSNSAPSHFYFKHKTSNIVFSFGSVMLPITDPDSTDHRFRTLFPDITKDKRLVDIINARLCVEAEPGPNDKFYRHDLVDYEHEDDWDQSVQYDDTKLAAIVIND